MGPLFDDTHRGGEALYSEAAEITAQLFRRSYESIGNLFEMAG